MPAVTPNNPYVQILQSVNNDSIKKTVGKVVAFYLSSSDCPPCRDFTPTLKEAYLAGKSSKIANSFEILLVSCDREVGKFTKYAALMPFPIIPFSECRQVIDSLSELMPISKIPRLIVIDTGKGEILVEDACASVTRFGVQAIYEWVTLAEFKSASIHTQNNPTNQQQQQQQGAPPCSIQ